MVTLCNNASLARQHVSELCGITVVDAPLGLPFGRSIYFRKGLPLKGLIRTQVSLGSSDEGLG